MLQVAATLRSYRLLQQRHHITHAPFAKSIHRHEIDESPAPRQYCEILSRRKLAAKHSLEAKLPKSLDLSNTRS